MPRPPIKPPIHHLAHDGHNVRQVECHRADIEHGADGRVARQPEQVDRDLEGRVDPDGGDGRLRTRRDALPDAREGEEIVARERKDGAAAGLDAGDGDEVHDGEAREGEEDGGAAAHGVEEELGDLGGVRGGSLGLGGKGRTGWPLGLLMRSRGLPMQRTRTRLKRKPMM